MGRRYCLVGIGVDSVQQAPIIPHIPTWPWLWSSTYPRLNARYVSASPFTTQVRYGYLAPRADGECTVYLLNICTQGPSSRSRKGRIIPPTPIAADVATATLIWLDATSCSFRSCRATVRTRWPRMKNPVWPLTYVSAADDISLLFPRASFSPYLTFTGW